MTLYSDVSDANNLKVRVGEYMIRAPKPIENRNLIRMDSVKIVRLGGGELAE